MGQVRHDTSYQHIGRTANLRGNGGSPLRSQFLSNFLFTKPEECSFTRPVAKVLFYNVLSGTARGSAANFRQEEDAAA